MPKSTSDDDLVDEAMERFQRCEDYESASRELFMEDLKFANGDSDNNWQWPDMLWQGRVSDQKPCLTINKTRQHNLQIINDSKQNKASVSVRPVGGGASYESAQVLAALVRYIEYQSGASVAYDTATEFQVKAGIGYWRISTDYIDDTSSDQDICIEEVPDPLLIYLDPDIKRKDGLDARYAFEFMDIPRKEFEKDYPEYADDHPSPPLGNENDWVRGDTVRIAAYWRRVDTPGTVVNFTNPVTGDRVTTLRSDIPKELRASVLEHPDTTTRETVSSTVEWYKIVGHKVAERKIWPGKYIPLVRVVGEETKIDGKLDRKGHTRALKDAQRMYNYWTSSAVENVALQNKIPYIASAESIEGQEKYWETGNKENYAVLPYNAYGDDGQLLTPPVRQEPPTMAQAYIQGMQTAGMEMQMVSGQYEPQMGQQGSERTGAAISARQRKGDNSTYHFIDNLAIAIRATGKIILDLVPKIYDTKRLMLIMAEDGTTQDVEIDPQAQKAYTEKLNHLNKVVQRVFNPNIGRYEVQADVGPAYSTRREEAFNAFTLILTQAPQMASLIGDILFRAGDFPGADEAAIRLKRMVPAQALGDAPDPQLSAAQQQIKMMASQLQQQQHEIEFAKAKLASKDQMRDIDVYEAETKRMTALQKMLPTDPEGLASMIHQLVGDSLKSHLDSIQQMNQADEMAGSGPEGTPVPPSPQMGNAPPPAGATVQQHLGDMSPAGVGPNGQLPIPAAPPMQPTAAPGSDLPPVRGARRAPDGEWYIPDPTRPGKFARLVKRGG